MGLALQLEHLRAPVWDEHEAIAKAIAQGNAALAEALITDHSEKASGTLAEQIAFASTEPAPMPPFNSVVPSYFDSRSTCAVPGESRGPRFFLPAHLPPRPALKGSAP